MKRIYNFNAGPAMLPLEVLQEVQSELLDLQGSGMSILEMSHRAPIYEKINAEAEADIKELLGLGDDYCVLADMSSDILSKPIPAEKFSLIYAGVQKNIGPAGAVAVIARKKFIEGRSKALHSMLNYETHLDNGSLYNTPPAFAVYIVGKVAKWLKAQGGLVMMEQRNAAKAKIVYDVIDMYPDFFRGFAKTDSRSLMNVTFGLPTEALEKRFAAEAEELGMGGLKGHRSVGGLRASIYNAMPLAGCEKLAEFMEAFYKMHK